MSYFFGYYFLFVYCFLGSYFLGYYFLGGYCFLGYSFFGYSFFGGYCFLGSYFLGYSFSGALGGIRTFTILYKVQISYKICDKKNKSYNRVF